MLLTALFALWLSAHSVAAGLISRVNSVPPSQDPFYTPPTGYESLAPGAIIRHRLAPNPLESVLNQNLSSNVKATHQILYRTTDSFGNAAASMTTLIIPNNAQTDKLLSYQTAYDQADNDCSPSYTLQTNNNRSSTLEVAFFSGALNQGWYVVTADYEGQKAALGAGIGTGQGVLDSIRAALNSNSFTQLQSTAKFALTGYSGGALASEWASELQPSYAKDLSARFLGAAFGGTPANLTASLISVNKGPDTFLIPTIAEGIAHAYSNFSSYLADELVPATRAQFESVNNCNNDNSATFQNKDIFTYFKHGSAILTDPRYTSVVNNCGIMGNHGTPGVPLYIYQGVQDPVVPVGETDKLVNKYCARNVRIQYTRNNATDHVTEAIFGSGGAFAWLQDRFAGKSVATGCSIKTVAAEPLRPTAAGAFGEEILGILQDALGLPLGPTLGWGHH